MDSLEKTIYNIKLLESDCNLWEQDELILKECIDFLYNDQLGQHFDEWVEAFRWVLASNPELLVDHKKLVKNKKLSFFTEAKNLKEAKQLVTDLVQQAPLIAKEPIENIDDTRHKFVTGKLENPATAVQIMLYDSFFVRSDTSHLGKVLLLFKQKSGIIPYLTSLRKKKD